MTMNFTRHWETIIPTQLKCCAHKFEGKILQICVLEILGRHELVQATVHHCIIASTHRNKLMVLGCIIFLLLYISGAANHALNFISELERIKYKMFA